QTIDLTRLSEAQIAHAGIGRKFQKPTIFEHHSAFENLELALKTDKGVKASMFFRPDSADCDRLAEVLRTIHLADSVTRLDEAAIANLGIGRKFQKPTVIESLTVFENLELALAADRRARASLLSRLSGAQLDRIGEVLTLIHLRGEAQRTAGLLSHGQKQWLEIGMLLMQDPKLLLLDEPVAGMTDEETERTAELFLSLEGQHSLVVVEHDMKFVEQLTQGHKKVTVLHEGSVLAEGKLADVQSNDKVVEVYLGR
ncbi:MAG TPA: ATP-binding cassette domain-containing protein, partial [Burkholderiaceae bacterium]|nr:ATP-binding cassette domain-containing protein [Burkholderiaceae bacterium]